MSRGFLVALVVAVGLVVPAPAPALAIEALEEYGAGELSEPRGVAVDPGDGSLYVADTGNDRIAVFDAAGDFSRAIGPGTLAAPSDVDVGGDSELYVADTGNDRVVVFSPLGEFLYAFGGGVLEEPTGVGFDHDGDDFVYVAEAAADEVSVFTPLGGFVRSFGATGAVSGQLDRPVDVALVEDGTLAVADAGNHRVDFFFESGQFIRAVGRNVNAGIGDPDLCTIECEAGEPDGGDGDLGTPSAVAAGEAGEVFVADEQWGRAVQLGSDGDFERSFGEGPLDLPSGIAAGCDSNVFVSQRGLASAVTRFAEPEALLPPCEPPAAALPVVVPPPPPVARIVSRFGIRRIVRNRRKGIAFAIVKVHSPGRLVLRGRGIRRVVRGTQRAPRLLRLPIRPKVRLRRYLRRKGRAKIRFKVTFRPYGGAPFTRERQLALRKRR